MNNLVRYIIGYIYPPRCITCHNLLPLRQLDTSPDRDNDTDILLKSLCRECADKFSAGKMFNHSAISELLKGDLVICDRCGEILPRQETQLQYCPTCCALAHTVGRIRSLYVYNNDTKAPLLTFKYFKKFGLAKLFSELIVQNLKQDTETGFKIFPETDWDYILPIPSSPDILKKRGYNHTYLITKLIAGKLGSKTAPNFLISKRDRSAQVLLSLGNRTKNMKNAFAVSKRGKNRIAGSKILLLDDMLTTGSTVDAAAGTLLDAHASSVDALTVFRSSGFSKDRLKIALDLKCCTRTGTS